MGTLFAFTPKPPYSFGHLVRRLSVSHRDLLVADGGALLRTLTIPALIGDGLVDRRRAGKPVLIQARGHGDIWHPELVIEVTSRPGMELTPPEEQWLERHLRRIFQVDVDLMPFYEQLGSHPYLGPVLERFLGFRLLLDGDLFESMVRTIIGQQMNTAFAQRLTARLVELGAQRLEIEGTSHPVFPQPAVLSALTVEQLRRLQFSRRKAEYVLDLARDIVSGQLHWPEAEELAGVPDEELIRSWTRQRGVGRWTVECVLIFGLGRPNLLPAADIGLRNGIRLAYGLDHQPTEAEVREMGAAWEPWCSYVTLYLWENLNMASR